jgi:hypothetical protein
MAFHEDRRSNSSYVGLWLAIPAGSIDAFRPYHVSRADLSRIAHWRFVVN